MGALDISDYSFLKGSTEAHELIERRSAQGKAIPLFVYGTLRDGGRLHYGYAEGIRKIRHEAQANGVLYFPGHRGFPGARFDEDGTMIGDLLWYPIEAETFHSVIRMELGAGYSLVAVQATYNRPTGRPHRKVIEALAFQHDHSGPHYERVPGNDWNCSAARLIRGEY